MCTNLFTNTSCNALFRLTLYLILLVCGYRETCYRVHINSRSWINKQHNAIMVLIRLYLFKDTYIYTKYN